MHVFNKLMYALGMKQYYNNINILQYLLLQYNIIWLEEVLIYCTLQYIVIHCNILQYLLS